MTGPRESFQLDWEGFALSINWCPEWLGPSAGFSVAHLEVIADDRAALPITETGYRSHFVQRAEVEALGGPVAYVRAWLDHAAQSSAWKAHRAATRQLSLF